MKTTTQPTLFSNEHESGYNLWFRKKRGEPWQMLGNFDTEREAWNAMQASKKKGGDWQALPAGQQP